MARACPCQKHLLVAYCVAWSISHWAPSVIARLCDQPLEVNFKNNSAFFCSLNTPPTLLNGKTFHLNTWFGPNEALKVKEYDVNLIPAFIFKLQTQKLRFDGFFGEKNQICSRIFIPNVARTKQNTYRTAFTIQLHNPNPVAQL